MPFFKRSKKRVARRAPVRIPDGLYEFLPYLYVISGVSVIVVMPNEWGVFSGLMFITAALAVVFMRREYRKAQIRVQASEARLRQLETERVEPREFKLIWRASYLCGNQVIDAQHRQLFDLSSSLLDAIQTGQPKSEVEFSLEILLTDLSLHFKTEEKVMTRDGLPVDEALRQMNRKLLARAEMLVEAYRRGTLEMGDLFGFIAYDLVGKHIAKDSKLFFGPG